MNRDEQPTLPGMPPLPGREAFRRPPPTSTVRYSRITSRRYRDLCGDCCQAIHDLGQEFAPLPKRALWRRSDEAGAVLLCQQHRDERVSSESR